VQDDGRTALAAQRGLRDPLWSDLEVEDEVVTAHRRALELVGQLVPDRPEVGVGRRQIRVLLPFDAGARAALRRVADRLRREPVRRVRAEVQRLPASLARDVLRENRLAVGRIDEAALDLELRDALDRVVLARR